MARFVFGDRKGPQRKTIEVRTDDDSAAAKTIQLTAEAGQPVRIKRIIASNPRLAAKLETVKAGERLAADRRRRRNIRRPARCPRADEAESGEEEAGNPTAKGWGRNRHKPGEIPSPRSSAAARLVGPRAEGDRAPPDDCVLALLRVRVYLHGLMAIRNVTPQQINMPPNAGRFVSLIILGIVALWFALSSFTSVPADSIGVLTRFGGFVELVKPGLRFKLPLGIDGIAIVPVERQLTLDFGFATAGATNPAQRPEDPEEERNIVTGDLNMALIEWIVQYRIEDPQQFLFHVREPEGTLRDASEAVMREVVGDRTIDEVLTIGRQEIEGEALTRLQALVKRYGLGLMVMQVQLQNVHPPKAVQASFSEVNQAQQEKQQAINLANGEYNKVVPRARGEALRKMSAAEGYAAKRVNEAKGDAGRFEATLAEYVKSPDVTRQRLYLETMQEVLPQLSRKILLDEKAGQIFPLLQLDQKAK